MHDFVSLNRVVVHKSHHLIKNIMGHIAILFTVLVRRTNLIKIAAKQRNKIFSEIVQ
jgi:hypothetical protein